MNIFSKKLVLLPLVALMLVGCGQSETEQLRERLQKAAAAFNQKKGGQRLDIYTTIFKLTVAEDKPHMVYHISVNDVMLKNQGKDPIAIVESLKEVTTGKVCSTAEMKATLDQGATYEYRYQGAGSKILGSFVVTAEDCK